MVFQWILSDSKSPEVSRTILSILVVLKNALVWMVSPHPPTFKSSSPFNNPLVTVPKAPITIGIIVTFMVLLFTFFQFYSVVSRDSKVHNRASSLFWLIIIRSGLLAEIEWSICTSKSHWSLYVSFSRRDAGLFIYQWFILSNLNFLQISPWISLST